MMRRLVKFGEGRWQEGGKKWWESISGKCGGRKEWPVERNREDFTLCWIKESKKNKQNKQKKIQMGGSFLSSHFPSQASSFCLAARCFCSER